MIIDYISFVDFLADASIQYEKLRASDQSIRYGQVYFNLLHESRPDIANELRGSSLDPFHRDAVSDETHAFVEYKW
jgi:hypothetical protein